MATTPLAITGMACRLPGAPNLEKYWDLLINGRCAIARIPDSKMERSLFFSKSKGIIGKTYLDKAGFVDENFVSGGRFRTPKELVQNLDSEHFIMCDVVAEACRRSGLDPFEARGKRIGVYIGHKNELQSVFDLDYSICVEEIANYLKEVPRFLELTGDGAQVKINEIVETIRSSSLKYNVDFCPTVSGSLMATAASRSLELDGPTASVDAACASSINALAIAEQELALGVVEAAIVGGASRFSLQNCLVYSLARALATEESRPFSELADGFVPAEGYVALVVKTLERALSDGDPIQAVVCGLGVSTDGKGKTLWAPKSEGRNQAILRAYDGSVDVDSLAYLEAHATSTPLGDAEEAKSLIQAFEGKFVDGRKPPLGSVKANIGHTIAAAGLAGLVKAVLVLQKRIVPPQINCRPFSKKIDWERLPFHIPESAEPIPASIDGKPSTAGVCSFGIGGINSFALVQEAPKKTSRTSVLVPSRSESRVASASSCADVAQEPIAIVGTGRVLPRVRTEKEFEELIFSGANVISEAPQERWDSATYLTRGRVGAYRTPSNFGGFIRDYQPDWRKFKIPPKQIASADPTQFMALESAFDALRAARCDLQSLNRERVGVVVASAFMSEFRAELNLGLQTRAFQKALRESLSQIGMFDPSGLDEVCRDFQEEFLKRRPAVLDETGGFTASTLATRIAKEFDFTGGALAVENGGLGSLAALEIAMNSLRTGANDLTLVAACSRTLGVPTFVRMGLKGELTQRPDLSSSLDVYGGRTAPGEGVAFFVLKRLKDALRDGDPVCCVLRGVGVASVSIEAPREELADAFERAIKRAWGQANVDDHSPDLIELSTSPPRVKQAELDAHAKLSSSLSKKVALGETEPIFGKLFSASGGVALLKAIAELKQGRVPKLLGYAAPRKEVADSIKKFADPLNETLLTSKPNGSTFACVDAWDGYGHVGGIVVEYRADGRYELTISDVSTNKTSEDVSPKESFKLLRYGASTRADLARVIRGGKALNRRFDDSDRVRAIVVLSEDESEDSEEFRAKLEDSANAIETLGKTSEIESKLERLGVVYAEPSKKPGKIAFMFSGQGSQYPRMLQDLIQNNQSTRKELDALNETLRSLEMPDFEDLTISGSKALGVDVFRTQLSLLCADWLVFKTLRSLGVRPDFVAGHSYGEFPALVASEAWTLEQGLRATQIRCQAIKERASIDGSMAVVRADGETTKRICAAFPNQAFAANFNNATQTAIGFSTEIWSKVEDAFRKEKIALQKLPVPKPYHTPLMAPVKPLLRERLVETRPRTPRIPFFSSVTNRLTTDAKLILDNLVNQMTEPVDYVDLTHKLVEQGVELFVEVGPKKVLTGLHQKIVRTELERNPNSKFASVRWFAPDAPGREEKGVGFYQLKALCEALGYFDANKESDLAKENKSKAIPMIDKLLQFRNQISSLLVEQADHSDGTEYETLDVLSSNEKTTVEELASKLGFASAPLLVWAAKLRQNAQERRDLSELMFDDVKTRRNLFERSIDRLQTKATTRAVQSARKSNEPFLPEGLEISPLEYYERFVSKEGVNEAYLPDQKYRRYRVRLMPREFPADVSSQTFNVSGAVLIYGDNETARELSARLTRQGVESRILPCTGDYQADAKRASEICEQKQTNSLFLLASHDERLLNARDEARKERRDVALGSFFVAQSWAKSLEKFKAISSGLIVSVGASGGTFGFADCNDAVEIGALSGLIKALYYEFSPATQFAFRAYSIDFAMEDSVAYKADRIAQTLNGKVPIELETGFYKGRRVLPRNVPSRAKKSSDPQKAAPSGLWVFTGGARGVTAFVARYLAQRYGLKLALVGSSPLPNVPKEWTSLDESGLKALRMRIMRETTRSGGNARSVWNVYKREIELARSLNEFARADVEFSYYSCDVTDRAALASTLEQIRKDHPNDPITGVFHGAGVERSLPFAKKEYDFVCRTFDIKAEGARNIIELTRKDPLRCFIAMGSMAGRIGSPGQSDYAMANDCMAKILDRLQKERPDIRVSAFQWGPWDEIGMAMRPETKASVLSDLQYLPVKEALEYAREELESDSSEPVEKMIAPYRFEKEYYKLPFHVPTAEERNQQKDVGASRVAPVWEKPAVEYELNRWEVRLVESDAPRDVAFIPEGRAVVYGSNKDADQLCIDLETKGVSVLAIEETTNADRVVDALTRFWNEEGPVKSLFLMASRSNIGRAPEAVSFAKRRQEQYDVPTLLCRGWLRLLHQNQLTEGAAVVAATAQGGGFGFGIEGGCGATSDAAVDGAMIGGVLKAVYQENGFPGKDGLIVRIVDAKDDANPFDVARACIDEIALDDVGIERCIDEGKRYVPRIVQKDVRSYPRVETSREPSKGSVCVVAGGARGVSARTAFALGKRFGVSLVLLGTAPAPNVPDEVLDADEATFAAFKRRTVVANVAQGASYKDAWNPMRKAIEIARNLREMRDAGLEVEYRCCNVLDAEETAKVLDDVRRSGKKIEGIVYGAGIASEVATVRDILDSQLGSIGKVVATKVDAALNLWEATKNDPLKYFVGFGSISGRFGSGSAFAYCAANEGLCKLVSLFRKERPNVNSVAFHWHGWGEVGMMMRPESYGSVNVFKIKLLSPAEGTSRIVDELLAGCPLSEVIVTDRKYFSTYLGEELELGVVSSKESSKQNAKTQSQESKFTFPLIEKTVISDVASGAFEASATFRPTVDPFLLHHRLRNRPLLPAVISMETFCEAFAAAHPDARIATIANLSFKNGLKFLDDKNKQVKIKARPIEGYENVWSMSLHSDFYNSKGALVAADSLYSQCCVKATKRDCPIGEMLDGLLAQPTFEWARRLEKEHEKHEIKYLPEGAPMWHGPVFQQLQNCSFYSSPHGRVASGEIIAFSVEEFAKGRCGQWFVPAATLDACLYLSGVFYSVENEGKISLPASLGSVVFARSPRRGERCRAFCLAMRGADGGEALRVVLRGEDDRALVLIDGLVRQVVGAPDATSIKK